jgi:polysaccharide biosynthesis/export protein
VKIVAVMTCAAALLLAPGVRAQRTGEQAVTPEAIQKALSAQPMPALPSLATGPSVALPTVELSGPVQAGVYRVGPGDRLEVNLWGPVTRSIPLEVGPEGSVMLPGLGPVYVAERFLSDVREDILRRLRSQYRNVNMDVRLVRPRTFRIYITGRVQNPGPVLASGVPRLGDVFAGSPLLPDASNRQIQVHHADGTREFGDLRLFLETGDTSLNPWLREGDVIVVPSATEFVYVEGALARPGPIELGVRDSVRTVLKLAGDPLPSAQLNRVLMVHFARPFVPDSIWLDLRDVYKGHGNRPLQDGDRLYVYYLPRYHEQNEVEILGEIARPGVYPIDEGHTRLSRLVSAAGGFQGTADLSAVRVRRRNPANAQKDPELDRLLRLSREQLTASEYEVLRTKLAGLREEYRVDWARLRKEPGLDLVLRDGDSVMVDRLVPSIRVDGEVRRPGILNYVEGLSAKDYVRQAGGYTNRAWQSKVRVTRSVTGQVLLARNVRTLDPGDFVWVPEKSDVTAWQQTREILTALAQLATVVIAIRSLR